MAKTEDRQLAKDFVNLMRAFYIATQRPFEIRGDIKVSSRSFNVLYALKYHPNKEITMSALAETLYMSGQQLSKLVSPLEEKGLVGRIHDTINRRQVFIKLTRKGSRVVDMAVSDMVKRISPELRIFTPAEKEQFSSSVRTLTRLLEKGEYQQW